MCHLLYSAPSGAVMPKRKRLQKKGQLVLFPAGYASLQGQRSIVVIVQCQPHRTTQHVPRKS